MMRAGLFILSFCAAVSHAEVPDKIVGTIEKAFCGNIYSLAKNSSEKRDTCLLWLKTSSGKKYGVFNSNNAYLDFLEMGSSAQVLVGKKVEVSSCEKIPGGFGTKDYENALKVITVDRSYTYTSCYPTYTKVILDEKDSLPVKSLSGLYVGKSQVTGKVVKALVTVFADETDQDDLFNSPEYGVDVLYFGEEPIKNDQDPLTGISFGSSSLKPVFSEKRSYFEYSFSGDCDDPDCYNADGELKFIRNRNNTFTLYLQFEHYNAHPTEEDSKTDFSEEVFMKKISR